jgi:hypothetical protein
MEQNLGINQQICAILGVGVGVEGILRQSADVEDVERRVLDYEQGRLFPFTSKWYMRFMVYLVVKYLHD